jgi:hypothetical protein
MSDKDVACYNSRYSDVSGDARQHFLNTGEGENRLPTCARNLSEIEAQKYLDRNGDLQKDFGRTGKYALAMAREEFTDYGFQKGKNVDPDPWDGVWYCGDSDAYECDCYGTLYRSLLNDPITGQRMESFTQIREHVFQSKTTVGNGEFEYCDAQTFGGDKLDGRRW